MSSGRAYVSAQTKSSSTGKDEYTLISPEHLTRSKLCGLSDYASRRLRWGSGEAKQGFTIHASSFVLFDCIAANKIFQAMVTSNIVNPTPMSVNNLRLTSFDEVINTYATARALRLHPAFAGNDLRDTIIAGIKKGPLKFKWFKRIIEDLCFDKGLVSLTMNHVMFGKIKGGVHEAPEMVEIRQYCILHEARYGLATEMKKIEVQIRQKMAKQAKEAADRKYEKEFPSLPRKKL